MIGLSNAGSGQAGVQAVSRTRGSEAVRPAELRRRSSAGLTLGMWPFRSGPEWARLPGRWALTGDFYVASFADLDASTRDLPKESRAAPASYHDLALFVC